MKKLVFFSFLTVSPTFAQEELNIVLSQIEWAPFYMVPKKDGAHWQGILPGIIQAAEKKFNFKVNYVSAPTGKPSKFGVTFSDRKELYTFFKDTKDKMICTIDAKEWMDNSFHSTIIISEPIYLSKDFPILLLENKGDKKSIKDMPKESKVAVGKGWQYPELEDYFKTGKLTRIDIAPKDTSTAYEVEFFQYLKEKKVDLMYANKDSVGYHIKQKRIPKKTVVALNPEQEGTALRLVCSNHPKMEETLAKIIAVLKLYEKDGTIEKIRNRYVDDF